MKREVVTLIAITVGLSWAAAIARPAAVTTQTTQTRWDHSYDAGLVVERADAGGRPSIKDGVRYGWIECGQCTPALLRRATATRPGSEHTLTCRPCSSRHPSKCLRTRHVDGGTRADAGNLCLLLWRETPTRLVDPLVARKLHGRKAWHWRRARAEFARPEWTGPGVLSTP